jgi:hypothetical protein
VQSLDLDVESPTVAAYGERSAERSNGDILNRPVTSTAATAKAMPWPVAVEASPSDLMQGD